MSKYADEEGRMADGEVGQPSQWVWGVISSDEAAERRGGSRLYDCAGGGRAKSDRKTRMEERSSYAFNINLAL
jgi:hypothetical protein